MKALGALQASVLACLLLSPFCGCALIDTRAERNEFQQARRDYEQCVAVKPDPAQACALLEKAYAEAARSFYGDPDANWRAINTRQKRWDVGSGPPDRRD